MSGLVATRPFFKPPPGEKPKIIILDSVAGQGAPFHHYRRGNQRWKRGERVLWQSAKHGNRLAQVSRVPNRPWSSEKIDIRLDQPVEVPNDRGSHDLRWAFDAYAFELVEPSAIDLLADLAG